MLTYSFENIGAESLYEHLYRCIRADILAGRLQAGEKLPSKRSLAHQLGISVITVEGAYGQLVAEGYCQSVPKKGFFVARLSSLPIKPAQAQRVHRKPEACLPEYLADFTANSLRPEDFPFKTWTRLLRQVMAQQAEELLERSPGMGIMSLRETIANHLRSFRGLDVAPEQIVVGAGTEYLYSRLMQILGTGLTFASADTGPSKFAQIAKNHGHHWRYFPIDEKNLRVDSIIQAPVDVVQLSPANLFPYGTTMPIDRRIAFFEWANAKKGRWIIEDDYDAEFCFVPAGHRSMFSEDAQDKVIYLNTFSKTMVPSLRISYMVLPPALLARYEETVSFYACSVSSFEQYALALFINRGYYERHLFRLLKHYRRLRAAILDEIRHSAVLSDIAEVADIGAGTHFLMTVRTDLPEAEIARRAEAQSLRFHFFHPLHQKPPAGCVQIIINFASIEADNVDAVFERLGSIF